MSSWKQRETTARQRRIAAVREWVEKSPGRACDGFPEWYEDQGLSSSYEDAYRLWASSPGRIERWAERQGIYVGRFFARWYLSTGRTDTYAHAYEIYRVSILGEEPRP